MVIEPLPSVNKVYSMILRVEKQRKVKNVYTDILDNVATMTINNKRTCHDAKNYGNDRGGAKKIDKSNLCCSHCNFTGHTKEICFKIHDIPDWYKDLMKTKGKQGFKRMANMADVDTKINADKEGTISAGINNKIQELIQQEISKLIKGKCITEGGLVNMSHFQDFAVQ